MSFLTPCPGCQRHVLTTETECPFCAAPLALSKLSPPELPTKRLGRAATFAFGATLLGASAVVSCGGTTDDDEGAAGKAQGGASAGQSGGEPQAGTGLIPVPVYGAPGVPGEPVPEAGSGGTTSAGRPGTTAGRPGSGGRRGDAGGPGTGVGGVTVQPVYGAPVPQGGTTASDGGAPSAGGGTSSESGASGVSNSQGGGVSVQPLYGAPTPAYGLPSTPEEK